jgi:hypothetical protein
VRAGPGADGIIAPKKTGNRSNDAPIGLHAVAAWSAFSAMKKPRSVAASIWRMGII